MQFVRVLLAGFVGTALGFAADLPSSPASVEAKLSKLEIRRISNHPLFPVNSGMDIRRTQPWKQYCRDKPRNAHCRVDRFGNWLQYALQVDSRRIFGPPWMADDDYYLIYFEFDVAGRCPSILRSLVREILIEKFGLTVRSEQRQSEALVLHAAARRPLAAFSEQTACSLETPPRFQGPQAVGEYPPAVNYNDGTWWQHTVKYYRGCTIAELAGRLKPQFRSAVAMVDETGASSRHDFSLHASSGDGMLVGDLTYSPERVAQELREQLGVDARLENRPQEFLSVDAPKPPKRISYEAKGPIGPAPCPEP